MKATCIWLIVLIPLAWGVSRSIEKSRPLFNRTVDATND